MAKEQYLFEKANQFMHDAEDQLIIQIKNDYFFIRKFLKFLFFPITSIQLGSKDFFKAFSRWAILMLPVMLLNHWLMKIDNLTLSTLSQPIFLGASIVVLFLVTFVAPSFYGINKKTTQEIKNIIVLLNKYGFNDNLAIEFLKKNIDNHLERVKRHINHLKWFVAILWASFIYCFAKVIDLVLIKDITNGQELFNYVIYLLIALIFIVPAVWGYEACIHKFFYTIQLGCDEVCYQDSINHKAKESLQ